MSGQELFSKGNEAFVAENYEDAVELYTSAIEQDDSKDEFYSNRSHAYIKLEKYAEAAQDATRSLSLNSSNTKAYLRKGIAKFHLNEYEAANEAFTSGKMLDASDKQFQTWIARCSEKIKDTQTKSFNVKEECKDKTDVKNKNISDTCQNVPGSTKTRYDWYQTETNVIISIMLKNVKRENLRVDVEELTLSTSVKLEHSTDYNLELDLAHPVIPSQSTFKILTSKIEIKLKKRDGIRWQKLEGDGQQDTVKHFNPTATETDASKYPSSSHVTRDWDKIVAEIKAEEKDEKPEGDAALNSLFQQIYADGSDEVKRAMNKSFQESGGTVLSTNWTEVGDKQVEVKPPDGMEYKTWEY